jgi:hypothetical protein
VELLLILRILWDRRVVVAIGLLAAVAAGLAAGHGRKAADANALGSLRMVLDTTDSQLVAAAPAGAGTLPTRATLLADTLSTGAGTALVARNAHLPADQVAVLGPDALSAPVAPSALATRVAAVASTTRTPYLVDVLADDVTPIISVAAYAPDRAQAGRLAAATGAALQTLLATKDATHSAGYVLHTFAQVRTRRLPAASTHQRVLMAGTAIALFGSWCACVVLATGTARRRRARSVSSAA